MKEYTPQYAEKKNNITSKTIKTVPLVRTRVKKSDKKQKRKPKDKRERLIH